jgi:ribosomal protein S18 acetylase RimI-like enzyme
MAANNDRDDQNEPINDHESALTVRPAHPADRDLVLALCTRIWGEHDYIEWVWDDWLRDAAGVLLVATLDGRPVGIVHLRMMSDEEAWIEGVRVDPDLRRQGIGRTLVSRAMVAGRERGASVVRLFTDWDNLAAQQLFARFGFVRVAELVRYRGPALDAGEPVPAERGLSVPSEQDFERIWSWLEQSNLAPLNGGLEMDSWAARAVTEPVLRAHLAAGHVRLLEEWGTIQALAVVVPVPEEGDQAPYLEVRYLDGAAGGIGRLALALRAEAREQGLAQVKLWLPDLLILQDAMAGAGYVRPHTDDALWVYARTL